MRLYRAIAAALGDEAEIVDMARRLCGDDEADRLDIKLQLAAQRGE